MSDPEMPQAPAKSTRDPAALSSEYHKAHKQLMLWSAILFVWEFVGIDLSEAKDAGGYIGPIVKALKSPQAVPWVLLLLVFYFLFKCSIEWAQCHVDRRKIRFARVDYVSALIVASAAIALYIGQAVSRVQFADILQDKGIRASLVIGISVGFSILILSAQRIFPIPQVRMLLIPMFMLWVVASVWITGVVFDGIHLQWTILLITMATFIGLTILMFLLPRVFNYLPKK